MELKHPRQTHLRSDFSVRKLRRNTQEVHTSPHFLLYLSIKHIPVDMISDCLIHRVESSLECHRPLRSALSIARLVPGLRGGLPYHRQAPALLCS